MARKRAHGEGTISRRTDGTWEAKVSLGYGPDGKRKRKTVYGKTQAEVREKLEALKRQLADGTFSDTRLDLSTYCAHWLEHKARTLKPRSVTFYRETVARHIAPRLGHYRLNKLTPLAVETALGSIAESVSPNTANQVRTTLHAALRQAVRWQLIPRNPVEATERLKVAPAQHHLWTPAQAAHFLNVAAGHRLYAAFYLLLFTGLRCGELLGLEWDDLPGDSLYVQRALSTAAGAPTISTPKTARGERVVPLAEDVLEVLEHHRCRQAEEAAALMAPPPRAMFTAPDSTRLTYGLLSRTWRALEAQAEVPHMRLHDLRHFHVSLLVARGFDPRTIADRVGHGTAAFTVARYAHPFAERRKAAALGRGDLLS
jgi:integrase